MAKKNEKVVLEDIELKPQVIGHIYEKKTNFGRVVFIFIVFLLVVYFINDISVFINKLVGKNSADTIVEMTKDDNRNIQKNNDNNNDYYEYSSNLIISLEDLTITNFMYENNELIFNVYNYNDKDIDLSNKKYYLETYDNSKKLLENLKLNFSKINSKNKISLKLNINKDFKYIKIVEKNM